MTIVVAFDGSALAESALARGCELTGLLDEKVLAITAIPQDNRNFAIEHGWLDADEPYDAEVIRSNIRDRVSEICPDARFKAISVGRRPSKGSLANKIRKAARAENASTVVVGSENAGRITTGLSSVGGGIATDSRYDVYIVRS